MPQIILHHLENSRSQRILWLLEELELPYELKIYKRNPETMRAPPELKAVHPLGRSPVLTIDELVLAESGAIIEHVLETLGGGRLRPAAGSPEQVPYRFWMHYAEGSLMAPLLVKLIFSKLRTGPVPFFIKPIARGIADKVDASYTTPEIRNHFSFVEQTLAAQPWFAGEAFTGADIQMSYGVGAGLERAGMGSECPNATVWLARCKARPAYRRAIEKGGSDALPG